MTDRELLERAAKAAGIVILRSRLDDPMWRDMLLADVAYANGRQGWNPLTDDGDALRLAVKLRLEVNCTIPDKPHVSVYGNKNGRMVACHEQRGFDPYAATRRAIVRAAAEMAK